MDPDRTRPLLGLWATPRTVSTAFERMVIERGDHLVLDEPFSRAYYFGPERRSDRYPLSMPESTFAAVLGGVLECADGDHPVFVKDMAYQADPGLTDDALPRFRHTFLIRHPGPALASLARAWPDFTPEEAGYAAQHRLFERVVDRTGTVPVVIDSDDLRRDPATVVGAWCRAMGIPERPGALTWASGTRPEWPLWHDWYERVARSTAFRPPSEDTIEGPDPAWAAVYAESLPRYEALAAHRVVGDR